MKQDTAYYHIALLKQQARHGQTPPQNQYVTPNQATEAELQRMMETLKNNAEALSNFGQNYFNVVTALNKENLALQSGINAIAKVYDMFETSMVNAIKSATFLEQRNKSLNKSFGITSITAAELGEKYDEMSKVLETGGENVRKYAQDINKILPGMSKLITGAGNAAYKLKENFGHQLLGVNQLLTENLGLTGDAANNYQLYAAGAGQDSVQLLKTTQAWAASFDAATGMAGTFAGVVSDIADLGADIQTQYNKMPGSLEKSVVKAKLLGTTFKQIEAMATKMLNIEESVGAELEYQLLSGKRLTNDKNQSITENLRIAKLSGNAEAQVKAMNDLLSTQGDILDGNNYYAKEQLANLTGFTVAELTRQRQIQKLMEQGGMDKAKIEEFMDMGQEQFIVAAKKLPEAQQEILKKLKESESQKTTDELYADMLQRERTEGINVMLKGTTQKNAIEKARTEAEGSYQASKDFLKPFGTKETATLIGHLQVMGDATRATNTALNQFAGYIPVVGQTLKDLISKVNSYATTYLGTSAGPSGPNTLTTPVIDNEDALLVNDAMIQFHPADKFATVSDGAALLASTERGKLDSAVNTLTGNTGNGIAIVDPAPIAAAIMASLRNMKVEVNYDVTAAASAANFKFNQGING